MAEGAGSGERFVPARYQPPLPLDRLLLPVGAPGAGDRMELDVLIVGAGGERAAALGVNIFTGFPAASLLVDGQRVAGVRTAATGLDREGQPLANYMAPNDLIARVTALGEGTRGSLSQAWLEWRGVTSENAQIFALGVKEVWETRRPLDTIVHTLGWPVPTDAFGARLQYPLAPDGVPLRQVLGPAS